MYVSFKNKCLISLVLILATVNFTGLSAVPKTWTKDSNGRVLVYRAEPSKAVGVIFGLMTATGLGISSVGFWPGIPSRERLLMILGFGTIGSIVSIPSALAFKYLYYDECNLLYKPLIIIDKHGITYDGQAKILWKNVCGYRPIENIIYNDGYTHRDNYIEISTDVDRLQIHEGRTTITWQMLYKLIDEAYKSYQEFEKEKVTA